LHHYHITTTITIFIPFSYSYEQSSFSLLQSLLLSLPLHLYNPHPFFSIINILPTTIIMKTAISFIPMIYVLNLLKPL
jgi:hypothetical protein